MQSLRPTSKKKPLILRSRVIVIVLILLIPSLLFTIWTFTGGDPSGKWVLVTEVVDGDTIYVGRGWRSTKVRLIGVDAPETVHSEKPVEFFGPEASAFTKRRLDGEKVRLEFEPSNQYDDYGRLLAYVITSGWYLFQC